VQVLFDQGTPAPLRQFLTSHQVFTAYERGWSTLKNGELLQAAELAAFSVLVTTDTNLKYQQNLATRRISIVVLSTTSWPRIQDHLPRIIDVLSQIKSGEYREISFN